MSASLLDSLTGLITPDLASKAASMFGESDSSVRKGMTGALPVVLSGLASRAGDPGFAGSLFDLVRSPANDDNVLNDLGGLLGGGTSSPMMGLGGKLLSTLFGGNIGNVASALAGYAGVKSSTGASLLNLAAPLVLAVLGRKTRSEGLNASSLASLLLGQKDSFAAALPGPLANIGTTGRADPRARGVRGATAGARASLVDLALARAAADRARATVAPVLALRAQGATRGGGDPAGGHGTRTSTGSGTRDCRSGDGSPTATVYFDVDQSALPAGSEPRSRRSSPI